MAKWSHLFPSRTQKLSTFTPMVVRLCESRKLPGCLLIYGGLAQLGEHLPYKQRVSGSSPLASTIIFAEIAQSGRATDL